MTIRLFEPEDYAAIVAIENAASRHHHRTIDEIQGEDTSRPTRFVFQRYVADLDRTPVGFGFFNQWGSQAPPDRFYGNIYVHPNHERHGIGSALYDRLMEAMTPYRPKVMATWIRENLPHGIRFLEKRGFREFMRDIESQLDVASFDPEPFLQIEEKLRDRGIRIRTLNELAEPDRDQRLYAFVRSIEDVMPRSEPFPPVQIDEFRIALRNEERPDAYFVATHENEYIAKASFYPSAGVDYLFTALTAVLPAYRHMGVATALKVREILYAKSHGHARIRTENRADNIAMLSLNKRLGFVPEPANIGFKKKL